ncbi:hypothetical protein [Stratiformator vulcanicus]|uniref:DUF3352 domain-containing protein n=1 Tax=Stratiformator vulcanicus TaxID=2527980 RepID=A0A517QZP4_9PLAN|nr:hypothetical protein [Stratiformator vulcanicus]QDT37101.1 hypothetical protein Pan189_14690 [Stratiformator vulcanicus]
MRRTGCAAVGLCVWGATALAIAAEPFEMLPGDTDVVVRLKSPAKTVDALTKFVQEGVPAIAPQAGMIRPSLGMAISNPGLAGVDDTADWWVAAFANKTSKPSVVFIVPTKDKVAAKAALGDKFSSKFIDDYLVYSASQDALDRVAGDAENSLESSLSDNAEDTFEEGDLSAWINVPHLREVYSGREEEARQGFDQFVELMKNAAAGAGDAQKQQIESAIPIYKAAFEGAVVFGKDLEPAVFTISPQEKQLLTETLLTVKEGSQSAKTLAKNEVADLDSMKDLPTGAIAYYGLHCDMKGLIESSMNLAGGMYGDDYKQSLEEFVKVLEDVDFGSSVGAVWIGDLEFGLFRFIGNTNVEPIERYRDAIRELTPKMELPDTPGLTQEMTFEPEAETISGEKVDLLTMTQTFDAEADPSGMAEKVNQALLGPDGMQQWIAYFDDTVVQTIGPKSFAETAIKTAQGESLAAPVPTEDAIEASREFLSSEANVVLLVDWARMLADGTKVAANTGAVPFPIYADKIDELGIEPSFGGFSMTTEENAIRMKSVLPIAQVKGISDLVDYVRQAMQPPQ